MANLNLSPTEALSRMSGLMGFLSSIEGDSAAANLPSANLFESLLSDASTILPAPNLPTVPTPSAPAPSNNTSDSAAASSFMDSTSSWRSFLDKLRNNSNGNSSSNNSNSSSNSSSAAASTSAPAASASSSSNSPSTAASGTTQSSSSTTPTAAASSSSDSSSNSSSDPSNSIATLLAQLQAIMKMIEKQIQDAMTTGTATTTAGAGASDQASATKGNNPKDLMSAADMLSELLALAQFAEKKLNLAASLTGNASADPSGAQNPAAANLTELEAQLKANLKNLLGALQSNTNNGAQDANTLADSATPSALLNVTPVTAAASATTTAATGTKTTDLVASALTTADDFIDQLSALIAPGAQSSAFVASTAAAASDGEESALLDQGMQNGGGNAQASTSSNANAAGAFAAADAKSANPYSFASQLSATRAQNGGTAGLPTPVEQVMVQLSRSVKNGNDQMTIQLQPAELGRIDVKLTFSADGKVQGTVVASNPATLDLLLKDVRSLERALQDAGLRADPGSLQFSLGGQPGNTQNQAGNSSGSGSSNGGNGSGQGEDGDAIAAAAAADTDTWYVTPGRVNLKV